jgi:type I restriction enzyme S subunit
VRYRAYPGYKPSGVEWLGKIPVHWEIKKLRHLALLKSGESITSEQLDDGGQYPVYGGNGLRGHASRFTHCGDYVLIGRQGALCGNINYASGRFWASEHAVVVLRLTEFATVWMGELLRAMNLNQYSLSAAQPGLSVQGVSALKIPVPPLREQRAIADFLDRETAKLDTLLAKKRELTEKLKEKRTALISRTVTRGLPPDAARLDPHPKLKPSGIEWVGDMPELWETGNLRRFAQMKTGHTPSRSEPEYWEDCDIPWFTLADVWQLRDERSKYLGETKERISQLGLKNSAAELLPAGTVVFSRTASVGFSGIMPRPMATTQDFWNWVTGPKLLPEYLLCQFRAMRQEFERLTMGSTHKTIYQPDAARLSVCVPPLAEQRAIADYLDRETAKIDRMVAKVEEAIERLQEYRIALITAAVTGKIDVRGAVCDREASVTGPDRVRVQA